MAASRSARGGSSRLAFTVVEMLVALVLLSVGLLGIAGNGAIAMRTSSAAARERRAVQRAADRIALLRSGGCATARSGTRVDSVAALSERWSVGAPSGGAALVDAEVRWNGPSGARVILLRSGILC
jgi:Tfp pilus assembly protein PilV